MRRNLDAAEVGAAEANAVVGGSGLERERDLLAGMKTDPGAVDQFGEVCVATASAQF